MNSYIKEDKLTIMGGVISVDFSVSDNLRKYFAETLQLTIAYDRDMTGLPLGIAIIPFVCDMLPIAWLTGASIEVNELDKDFAESLAAVKNGYVEMYPMLDFNKGGKETLKYRQLVANKPTGNSCGAFFTGGVDAFTTLVAHADEKPLLMTIRGTEMVHKRDEVWDYLTKLVSDTAQAFSLDHTFIISNFKWLLKRGVLDELIQAVGGEDWWHSMQHGIGIASHAAPLTWKCGLRTVFMASSYSEKYEGHITCASDPRIEGCMRYAGAHVVHDQFDKDRQDKLRFLLDYTQKTGKKLSMRVCWKAKDGANCCECEKCSRTMMGVLAEGGNPADFSFRSDKATLHTIEKNIKRQFVFKPFNFNAWKDIQREFRRNFKKQELPRELRWVYDFNFDKVNDTPYKVTVRILKNRLHMGRVLEVVKRIWHP